MYFRFGSASVIFGDLKKMYLINLLPRAPYLG